MHPTNGTPTKTSSRPTTSTLRPRTRRLISIDDELDRTSGSENGASPYVSRTSSPAPSTAPSRRNVTSNPSTFAPSAGTQASSSSNTASSALSGLWGNSWSAIQGLATNVLGNDAAGTATTARRRKPLSSAHHRRVSNSAPPPKQWGPAPSSTAHVGAGPQEERENLVRAMKRKDLLTANDHVLPDSVGRIKRRNSDDRTSASAPPGENEDRDALVYVHRVRPQDTLAGLSIKYNIQLPVLRKANRMWPNDSVQTKDQIILPVDACGVKGRPVAGPGAHDEEDLLMGEDGDATPRSNSFPNGWGPARDAASGTRTEPQSSSHADTECAWKHASWVLLPNDTNPTQIGRMPRRALGFFPPARRKSLAFSDSTPSPSVDLPRSSISTNSHQDSPKQPSTAARPSPSRASFSGPRGRQRSSSNFSLSGPGGVGTMGKNVRGPGPAQDGLNKYFASHLPSVAPPPGQEYFTPWAPNLLDADSGTAVFGGSGAYTPLGGPGIDFQEIGGAIEGWMRKVGSQASKLLSEPSTPGQGRRSAVPVIGAVGGDLGDLIELQDDAFDIGDGEREIVDRERGRSGIDDLLIQSSEQRYQSTGRPELNLQLRGRQRGGSGGKKD
ncbi:carbohydrate-binding module family 50 protein [Amniculicola lignicola CBS 123094]|uniref:Carbohydrate-binding module family 50 protein n=1 Tax=Amniculicola lignicola CBS 123094 TaxID=1392246 RepID=A0A6A5W3A0_9PLEO|nr:carbohydrate-binding module family 50 protein [Amniculicola lignicola CBS 123094]